MIDHATLSQKYHRTQKQILQNHAFTPYNDFQLHA